MAAISKREPRVGDQPRQRLALREQSLRTRGEGGDRRLQGRRRAGAAGSASNGSPVRGQRVERQVDAVEVAKILTAVLQVVDDLQGGADGIRRRPGALARLAVHVEHEAADRHCRQRAVVDQFRPVRVAVLSHVDAQRRRAGPARASASEPRRAASSRRSGWQPDRAARRRSAPLEITACRRPDGGSAAPTGRFQPRHAAAFKRGACSWRRRPAAEPRRPWR